MLTGIKTSPTRAAQAGRAARRGLLLAALSACVGGCGFRLASPASGAGAIGAIYLETPQPNSEFGYTLRDALRIRGVPIVAARDEARMAVRILEDTTGQRILSVSARNVPREYEVFYLVSFVLEAGDDQRGEAEQLIAVRNYTFDETQRLGKSAEEEALRRMLAAELTARLIRRIESTAGGAPGAIVLLPPSGS